MKKLLIVIVSIALCVWLASDMWARGGRGGGGGAAGVAVAADRAAVGHHEVVVAPEVAVRARAAVLRGVAEADRAMLLPGRRRCRGRVLRTLKDQVAAKLQIIGHRWVLCPRPAIAQATGPEIGQVAAMSPIGRMQELGPQEATLPIDQTQEIGPAQATLPIGRTQVIGQALARGSVAGSRPGAGARPSTRDVQDFLNLPNAGGGNVGAGRPSSGFGNTAAAIAGGALAGGAAAEFLQKSVRAMRFRCRQAGQALEIAVDAGLPAVSREIEWMPV